MVRCGCVTWGHSEWVRQADNSVGEWLREIYKDPEAWKGRLETEEHGGMQGSPWDLEPRQWIEWFNRSYGLSVRLPEFESPEEFHEWAFDLLSETERHLGPRPSPPAAALAAFVLDDQGVLWPLSRVLGPQVRLVRDEIGREQVETVGPTGEAVDRRPVFRAKSSAAALQEARRHDPRAILPPPIESAARKR
jgi:hypothetical protein